MINSMTAFARAEHRFELGILTCELRSTNHRFLEIGFHAPEFCRPFEMLIREHIRRFAKRGKVDCLIRFQPAKEIESSSLIINQSLVKEICLVADKIAEYSKQTATLNPIDVLRFPGVLETKETETKHTQEAVLTVVDSAAKELLAARQREGQELERLFLLRMDLMENELSKVKTRLPQVMLDAKTRLVNRFNEAKLELDSGRLEQEMVMFAQKIDVAEELDRATTHINEFRRALNQDELVGRRLDFLLQEMNRESNTLGSKSVDTVLTHAAVELKVLIEQVREQVQNVE